MLYIYSPKKILKIAKATSSCKRGKVKAFRSSFNHIKLNN